jgi:hypothetical protein
MGSRVWVSRTLNGRVRQGYWRPAFFHSPAKSCYACLPRPRCVETFEARQGWSIRCRSCCLGPVKGNTQWQYFPPFCPECLSLKAALQQWINCRYSRSAVSSFEVKRSRLCMASSEQRHNALKSECFLFLSLSTRQFPLDGFVPTVLAFLLPASSHSSFPRVTKLLYIANLFSPRLFEISPSNVLLQIWTSAVLTRTFDHISHPRPIQSSSNSTSTRSRFAVQFDASHLNNLNCICQKLCIQDQESRVKSSKVRPHSPDTSLTTNTTQQLSTTNQV